jgi:hypothetical protein
MSSSPHSCRAFRSISLRSVSIRSLVVNLLFYLADQLLRGCQSADNQVQALQKSSDWRFFSPWFPASEARSWSSTNPAFCTAFSPLLDFSGSEEFGIWRICVPLFWATYKQFSIFLLFWILKRFCLWIFYTLFTLDLLRHQRGYFITMVFLYSVYHLSFWDKNGEYVSFWTGNVFLNQSSDFCPKMAKMGVC